MRSLLALTAIVAAAVGAVMTVATVSEAQEGPAVTTIYDDALRSGFADWSWAATDLASTDEVASGSAAIGVDLGPWSGLSLGNSSRLAPPDGAELQFSVHGGANERVALNVVAMDAGFGAAGAGAPILVPGGQWTTYTIPLADLGASTSVGGFWWQEIGGTDPSPIYVDDVRLVLPGPDPEPDPDPDPDPEPDPDPGTWAFEETFDGDPAAPSQDLLPRTFDYVATHRSHPKEHFTMDYGPFLVDHAPNCAGPNPEVSPLPQRPISSTQDSNGSNPDPTFFLCKNHMMSSMGGDVVGYSVSSFWPRQEFDFADGGVLEFEVNINDAHGNRSWWEIMLAPRDQLKVAPGPVDSPISETYPDDRIVLDFRRNVRTIKVGTGALAPDGWLAKDTQRGQWDFAWWRDLHPDDPALDDRRVRRTMRIELEDDRINWGIETADGSFDTWSVDVPGGLPFDRGLVLFKTHAYNPTKDGNLDTYTFHWDNIRFDGPVVGRYDVAEADDVVYLQRNGDRPIGDRETVTIDLDTVGPDPVLFGQIHQPKQGQVLLSVNGGPDQAVTPYEYDDDGCLSTDWKSFRLELDPAELRPGPNTFTWTVGPRPDCSYRTDYHWDGFSVKFLQIQTEAG